MLTLDRSSKTPLYLQVYEQIANGIDNGLYESGRKLPSIRACAHKLGVSNTTIELAYLRLVKEGYATSKRGSGYTICRPIETPAPATPVLSVERQAALDALIQMEKANRQRDDIDYDFRYDAVDATLFPFAAWARISREVFLKGKAESVCLYNDQQGLYELREEIAHYLASEYAIPCIPEQVLIAPTTRSLIGDILSLFEHGNTTIAMEEPGYNEVAIRLSEAGFSTADIPVVPYPSWEEAATYLEGADIVFTTPVSQFPSNATMPIETRKELVAWANETRAYIIDDEYCWEFETGNPRLPALAAIDNNDRVITLGTFSNLLAPSICLSYAVLPPALMVTWKQRKRNLHPSVPWQTQAAMAEFMRSGQWLAHIRRTRTAVQQKRELLNLAMRTYLKKDFEIIESKNSLFALAYAHDGRTEQELIDSALQAGVRVYPTSPYWHAKPPEDWRYVLIGFAGIPSFKIEPGIKELAKAWKR